jgi:ubiquinone/menaquinone biosynthesis C-methylase UbiE
MGLYNRHIFPRLCDRAMRDPRFGSLRREVLAHADGEILEIGFGTGLNLEHYPERVRRIVAVDPGLGMTRLARRRIERSQIEVELHIQTAEDLPFEDGRFDYVLSTWTLCSIPDAGRAIAEIRRVLRLGGRFAFLEHGLGEDPGVQRWQRRLSPIQQRLADGCRLDLDIETVVRTGGFPSVRVERFLLPRAPRILGSLSRGWALN